MIIRITTIVGPATRRTAAAVGATAAAFTVFGKPGRRLQRKNRSEKHRSKHTAV
jgi:hypothetical protein